MITSAFHEELAKFPSAAISILNNIKSQQGRLDPEQVQSLIDCLNVSRDDLLKMLLPLAASMSTNPVSHFAVGVIVEGHKDQGHGPLYFGANLEISGQPLKMSIHAEQSAVCNAWTQGETRIRRLMVNEAPCGHCRQFLNELNEVASIEFIVSRLESDKRSVYNIPDLLPSAFGPEDLGQKERLLLSEPITVNVPAEHQEDELVTTAAEAASHSYAPYSGCFSGVALKLKNGRIVTGRYAENAAFNPSMLAVESALVNWRLATLGPPGSEIVDAVLIEKNEQIAHKVATKSILAGFGVALRYIAV